jgi:DNA-binding response OmpR family regulator
MTNKKALVIEDDSASRSLWELVLREQGYEMLYAPDLETAGPLVSDAIQVFVVDQYLPDGQGVDIVGYIRQEVPQSIILVVSMDDDATVIHAAMQQGGNIFVVKPAAPSVLRLIISEVSAGKITAGMRELINRNGRRAYAGA